MSETSWSWYPDRELDLLDDEEVFQEPKVAPGKKSLTERIGGVRSHTGRPTPGKVSLTTGITASRGAGMVQRRAMRSSSDPGQTFARAASGPEHPLPHRATMERAFGHSFAGVNAHVGKSAEMDALGADAATRGDTVVFATEQPDQRLVAHELTHVVQNRQRGASTAVQASGVAPANAPAEREADRVAAQVVAGRRVQVTAAPGDGIQLGRKRNRAELEGISVGEGAEIDNMGAASNNVQTTQQAQVQETAYVATVPTNSAGKNKDPAAVAAQYRDEAFQTPAEAARRFGLVVGVNRKDSALQPAGPQQAQFQQDVNAVQGVGDFPMAILGLAWHPRWMIDDQPATVADVRNAIAEDEDLEAEVAEQEAGAKPPVGAMRNAVKNAPQTQAIVDQLSAVFADVYIHVGDPDAVNLKAKATEQDQQATPLFDRYDQVLADHKENNEGKKALLATGGYRFRKDDGTADPHQGQARNAAAEQTVYNNELDMAVRDAVGGVNPAIPYMPEPNMLIHSSVNQQADFEYGKQPGTVSTEEARRLVESLTNDRTDTGFMHDHMAVDSRAGLYTDVGRFDDNYIQADKNKNAAAYQGGLVDMSGTFNQRKASQSHAVKRMMQTQLQWLYKTGTGTFIESILKVLLPQDLMDMTQPVDPQVVRARAVQFADIVKGLSAYLRDALNADKAPPAGQIKTDLSAILPAELGPQLIKSIIDKVKGAVSNGRQLRNKPNANIDEIIAASEAAGVAVAQFLARFPDPPAVQEDPE